MSSSLGLFLLLLTFSSSISFSYAAKTTTQPVLFDRVNELLNRNDKTDSNNLRFRPNITPPQTLLSTSTKSQSGQADSTSGSGNDAGDTLFDEDFSVTTPEESADPLSNVNEQTQQNAQNEQTNAQEDRLLNKETQATPTQTEEAEEATTTNEPDTSLNPSNNPELADKIDDIREEYGLSGISQMEEAEPEEAPAPEPEEKPEPEPEAEPEAEPQEEEKEEAVVVEAEAEVEPEEAEVEFESKPVVTDIDKRIQDENMMFGGEETDQDWEVQYAVFFCMAMTALIIIVVYLRNFFDKYCNHVLMRRVSYVSRDVITILVIITLILWLRFQGVNIFNIQVNKVGLSCSVFALGWFAWCVYVVLFAQARSVNWENKEIQCNMRVKILREYQILYDKIHHGQTLNRDQKKTYEKYQGELKYFLLRQNFILPSYLPIIRESILREDFNFAGYLTLCLEKGLENLFKISSATIISVFIVVQYWSGIAQIKNDLLEELLFGGLIPFVSYIFLQTLKSNFSLISENLRTPLEDPHKIELVKHDNQKDPWVNLKNRPPPYLDNLKNVFFHPERTLKGQKRPNLHESLFWAGSPAFSLAILHITAVIQIIWATVYFGYYLPNNTTLINIVYSAAIIGIFVFNLFYLVPSALFIHTVISNIEMRKDRELIKTTVAEQRKQLKDSLVKLYRLLKSAKREFTSEGSPGIRLKDFMVQIIKESFRNINPNLWEIKIQDLPKLAHLCGAKLEKDELVYLARSASQDLQTVIIDDFIWTVERTTKDVKLDPYATSCDVLRALNTRDDDFFMLKEFRELLVNHKVLSTLDIEEILYELRYFSKNSMEVEIPGIASLIRNTIEESPR